MNVSFSTLEDILVNLPCIMQYFCIRFFCMFLRASAGDIVDVTVGGSTSSGLVFPHGPTLGKNRTKKSQARDPKKSTDTKTR